MVLFGMGVEMSLISFFTYFRLHGSMTQVERSSIFKEFRAVKAGVLLCTVSEIMLK
jgi:superfamily II DNA/RNA helicase